MSKPKVAVLVSGGLRTLPELEGALNAQLEQLCEEFSPILILQTWSGIESSESARAAAQRLCALWGDETSFREEPRPLAPPWESFSVAARSAKPPLFEGFVSMWSGMGRAFEALREYEWSSGQKVDVVVRTRPDAAWSMLEEVQLCWQFGISRLPVRTGPLLMPSDVTAVLTRSDAELYFQLPADFSEVVSVWAQQGWAHFIPEYVLGLWLHRKGVHWVAQGSNVYLRRRAGHWDAIRADWEYRQYASLKALVEHGDNLPIPKDGRMYWNAVFDLIANADMPSYRAAKYGAFIEQAIKCPEPFGWLKLISTQSEWREPAALSVVVALIARDLRSHPRLGYRMRLASHPRLVLSTLNYVRRSWLRRRRRDRAELRHLGLAHV